MAGWGRGVSGRAARVWAGAMAIAFLAVGIVKNDREAMAFGVLTVLAAALTKVRGGLLGRIGLTLLALDTLAWMTPATVANARDGQGLATVAVPLMLAVLAIAVLLLAASAPPVAVLVVSALAVVVGLGTTVAFSSNNTAVAASERMTMKNVVFIPDHATVAQGTAIAIENKDLFWHTFSSTELDIDVRIATGATKTVTITAPPGTYHFVCRIPGHEQAGMDGTLIVSGADSS